MSEVNHFEFLDDLPADKDELNMRISALMFEEKNSISHLSLQLQQIKRHITSMGQMDEEESEGEEEKEKKSKEDLIKEWNEHMEGPRSMEHFSRLKELRDEHKKLLGLDNIFEILENMNEILESSSENNIETKIFKLTDIFPKLSSYPRVQEWAMNKIHSILNMITENLEKELKENLKKINWGIAKFTLPHNTNYPPLQAIPLLLRGLILLQVIREVCSISSSRGKDWSLSIPILDVMKPLVFDLIVRMNFHFFGKQVTNRSDRPSFIFTYIQLIRESYLPVIHHWLHPIIRDLYRFKSHLFITEDNIEQEDNQKKFGGKIRYFMEPTISFTNLIHTILVRRLRTKLGCLAPLILGRIDEEGIIEEEEKEGEEENKELETQKQQQQEEEEEESEDRTEEDLFMSWMNHTIEYEKSVILEFSYFGSPFDRGLMSIVTRILFDEKKTKKKKKKKKDEQQLEILTCFLGLEKERIVEICRKVYTDWKPYHDYDDEEDDLRIFQPGSSEGIYEDHSSEFMHVLKPSKSAYKVIHTLSMLNERYKLITNVKTRKRFFEEIHCYVLEDFVRFFSENLDRHLSPNIDEEEMEWKYFCSMMNSTLYCETNLRLWDKLPEIMDFSTIKKKNKEKKYDDDDDDDYNTSILKKGQDIYFFSDLADRFIICADRMTSNLIRAVMDYLKYSVVNKYERKLLKKRLKGDEMAILSSEIRRMLQVVEKYLERLRFNKIWRMLASQIDIFFYNHFKLKDESDVDFEIRSRLLGDIKLFFGSVFARYTKKPLNFAKKTKPLIMKTEK